MNTTSKEKDKSRLGLNTYIAIIAIVSATILMFLIKNYQVNDFVLLLIFSLLSGVAETYLIPLPKVGAVSVSFALTFSAILLTDPLSSAIITAAGVMIRFPYVEGKGRVHIFNNPLSKTVFNVCQSIINAGIAGILYVCVDKFFNMGFDFFNPLAALISLTIYILLNTFFMAGLMAIILEGKFYDTWKSNILCILPNIILVSLLGIVVAFSYNSYGVGGILLFFIPLMLARYTFKLYMDMRRNYFETINVLIRTIEANDPYTSGHSLRVSLYAESIGRELALPQGRMDMLKSAALLHDIGKIGIDKSVLNKSGKLSDEEFEMLKKHPQIGANILSDLSYLTGTIDIIKHHHECDDGSGYPDGLIHSMISLETSILTIADSFDAMTTDRPYRTAMTLNEAVAELRENAGHQFNPDIIEAAITALSGTYSAITKTRKSTL